MFKNRVSNRLNLLNRHQGGNIFALMFAAVGMVGVVGVVGMQTVSGPITTITKVTQKNIVDTDIMTNGRIVILNAATRDPDLDGDPDIEPVPFIACTGTTPVNAGGCLPADIGAVRTDPWGTQYGYCVWNNGATNTGVANMIDGATDNDGYVVAVISAGPDKVFNTGCYPYDGSAPEGVSPEIGAGMRVTGTDDIAKAFTYQEAVAGAGGLWNLVGSNAELDTSKVTANLQIGANASLDTTSGIADFFGLVVDEIIAKTNEFMSLEGALLLDNAGTTTADTCTGVQDGAIRLNAALDSLEICNGTAFVPLVADSWRIIDSSHGSNTYVSVAGTANTDTNAVDFVTAGASRMQVQSDGDVAVDTDTLFVDAANNRVGIRTATPGYALDVTSADTRTIMGTNSNATGVAVYGQATDTAGTNIGVVGQSQSVVGVGVSGIVTATTGNNSGVYGRTDSSTGRGVFGYAPTTTGINYGVIGRTDSTDGRGVYGQATATSGSAIGVYGRSVSSDGTGVLGNNDSLTGSTYGVRGVVDSPDGRGVLGSNTATTGNGTGVYGTTQSADGQGVIGSAQSLTGSNVGVLGTSLSSNGRGIYGYTTSATGTTYGVRGHAVSPDGFGGYFSNAGGGIALHSQGVATFSSTIKIGNGTCSTGTDEGKIRYTSTNDVQFCDGAAWQQLGGVVDALDDIGDVAITALAVGHGITWDGTNWVNGPLNASTAVSATTSRKIIDADGDTQIQVEEAADDDTIRFDTVGVERAQIQSDGDVAVDTNTLFVDATNNRVGIGTVTPASQLTVSMGRGETNDGIRVLDSVDGNNPRVILRNSTAGHGVANLYDASETLRIEMRATSGNTYFNITDNFGIGTATPFSKLHVAGDLLLGTATTCTASQKGALRMNGTADGLQMCNGAGVWGAFPAAVGTATSALQLVDADGDTKIQVEETPDDDIIRFDTVGIERMLIDSGGLELTNIGGAPDGSSIRLTSPQTNIGIVYKRGDGAGGELVTWAQGINSNQNMYFQRRGIGVTTGPTYLLLKENGNVGINNTDPQSKLHVAGDLLLGTATTCTASQKGALRMNATADGLQMCNGAGTWLTYGSIGGGDNLGNHVATQNIQLGGGAFWLNGDAGDEGIQVGASGNVRMSSASANYDVWLQGGVLGAADQTRNLALLGNEVTDILYLNYAGEYTGGVIIGSTVRPDTTNVDDLGTSGVRWRDGWFAGNVTSGTFTGNGAALTNLNASNLATGTVATARLGTGTANATTVLRGDGTWSPISGMGDDLGNHIATTVLRSDTTNTDDLGTTAIRWRDGWFAGNVTSGTFTGNGAALTNLNASNLATGTVATARLGTGTANATTVLRGDGTWSPISGMGDDLGAGGSTTGTVYSLNAGGYGYFGTSANNYIRFDDAPAASANRAYVRLGANWEYTIHGDYLAPYATNVNDLGTSGVRWKDGWFSGNVTAAGSIDAGVQFLGQAADTAAAPSFSWTGDTNAGIFRPGADIVSISTAGLERLRVAADGSVKVGSGASDASAIFQIDSTNRGFLAPRMTNAQRNAIATPATGLMIYNSTTTNYEYYDGTAWNHIGNGSTLPTLASTNIWVGNASNVATARALSGDATLSNTGVLTIGTGAVTSAKILDGTIGAADIAADAVTASEIASGAVTTAEILDGTIIAGDIATGAVTSAKILDGTIVAGDIAADAVGASEIATGAVTTAEILNGTILNADIANDTIVASTKLSATGTPSASNFLRGDNTWASPSAVSCPAESYAMQQININKGCGTVVQDIAMVNTTISCGLTAHGGTCAGTAVCPAVVSPYSCVVNTNMRAKCVSGEFVQERLGVTVTSASARSCGSCFAAGSMVLMADGSLKSIENVIIGDELMGADEKPTRVIAYDRPIMEKRDGDPQRLIQINDGGYYMTNNHPVLTTEGWKALWAEEAVTEAYDLLKDKVTTLEIGDEIIMHGQSPMKVEKIDVLEHQTDTRLYNFVLGGDPVFFVNGMAVMSFVPDKAGIYDIHLEHRGEPK